MSSIPNTLTIFINTRIRGYPKIKYSPNMTVKDVKSDSVYFDPLVKLSLNTVKSLPPNYPEKEKYTQFFNKNEFYGLIKRTISSTFQKKTDLVQATNDGYVDNNIDVILKTLFSPNSRFYIKGQPYTIYSYEWTPGDWRIDTKKFETRLLYSPYGSRLGSLLPQSQYQQVDAEKQLDEFKKKYPAEILNGYSTAQKYSTFEDNAVAEVVANNTVSKTQQNTFLTHLGNAIPSSFRALIGRDIIEQQSINVDESVRNIPSDPISLSILYSVSENYSKDVENNSTGLKTFYDNLLKSGEAYKQANEKFTKVLGTQLPTINIPEAVIPRATAMKGGADDKNVMTQKIKFDNTSGSLKDLISQYKKKGYTIDHILETPSLKDEFSKIIMELTEDQKLFLTMCLSSMKLLLEKMEKLLAYVLSLTQFYTGLREARVKALSKTNGWFQLFLVKKLFTFDVDCYESILKNSTILSNIGSLKREINNCKIWISRFLSVSYNSLEEMINYYQYYPELILIKKSELDIYLFRVILIDEKNESDIWQIISSSSVRFLETVKNYASTSIRTTQEKMNSFKHEYSAEQREALNAIISKKKEPLQKQTPIFYESGNTKLMKQMTNAFLQIQSGIIDSYDLITLYSRVSTIVFAREIAALTCKKNVNNTRIEIFGKSGFQMYYNLIYSDTTIVGILKEPMFWSIPENIQSAIVANNESTEQEKILQLEYNNESTVLQKKYTESVDLLIPQISSLGMLQQCLKISSPSSTISDDKDFNSFMRSKYDPSGTEEFRRHLILTYDDGTNDKLLEPISEEQLEELLEEWKTYGDPYDIGNSLFTSISIAFNVGLIKANKETNNIYSEGGMYSSASLRNAVADNIEERGMAMWRQLEPTLSKYKSTDPERTLSNFLFDDENHFIGNDPAKVKAAIRLATSEGGKYYGDNRTVRILEHVFKVKIIILHAEIIPPDKNYLETGQIVRFTHLGAEYQGTIVGNTKISDQYSYDILLEDHTVAQNIERGEITYIDSNFYTVVCGDEPENIRDSNEFSHYIILTDFGSVYSIQNYQVAYNTRLKQCVFTSEELPSYIYYLVFKSCWRSKFLVAKDKFRLYDDYNWYYKNQSFKTRLLEMSEQFKKTLTEKAKQQDILKEREKKAKKDKFVQKGGIKNDKVLSVPNKNMYIDVNNMGALQSNYGDSKLSYYIVIDLELYPGESIPIGEKAVLACQSRYEKIRQAYAQLFGIQYQPNEFYRDNFVAPNPNAKSKTTKSRYS